MAPPSAEGPNDPDGHPIRALWAIPALRAFVLARIFRGLAGSLLASTMAWHVYEATQSEIALGVLGIVKFLPVIPFALTGGALADSRDRVGIARFTQASVALSSLALVAIARGDASSDWIFVVALAQAAITAVEFPATGSILPSLVPSERFPAAVTLAGAARNAASTAGPVLGGFCIAAGGVATAYSVAAVFLAASVCALIFVPSRPRETDAGNGRDEVSLRAVREGIAFVRSRGAIWGSMTLDLFAVIFASVDALLPVFALEILEVGPREYGLLAGGLAAGTALMSAWMLWRPPSPAAGRALLLSVAVFGLATLLFAASHSFALSLAALVAMGMADQVSMVARETILQLSTPDRLRGRVNAVNFVFIGASNELGQAESGFLAAAIGTVASVWVGGSLCLSALGVIAARVPALRQFRTTEASGDPPLA